jgi:hypothetical protein
MWSGWVDDEVPRTYIIGHWNYPEGTVKPVYVVSTADEVELFVNGKSLGKGDRQYRYLHTFDSVRYESGLLEAVGSDGSRYEVQEPLKRMTRQEQEKQMSRYSGGSASSVKSTGSANTEAKSAANAEKTSKSVAGSKAPGTAGNTAGVSKNTSPSTTAKSSTPGSSVKSGFGGAGARSASS